MKWVSGMMLASGPVAATAYGLGWFDAARPEWFMVGIGLITFIGFGFLINAWSES